MKKRKDFTLDGPINEFQTMRDILEVLLDIRGMLDGEWDQGPISPKDMRPGVIINTDCGNDDPNTRCLNFFCERCKKRPDNNKHLCCCDSFKNNTGGWCPVHGPYRGPVN